jgi:RNA polymerase-binding transcription factor DksA
MIAKKLSEQKELRRQIGDCGHKPGEVCDEFEHADMEIERAGVCRRIDVLNEDLARIRAVYNMLSTGWDGTCIDGCGESVLPRLLAGHFTRRCCGCKTAREEKAKRGNKASLRLVYT